MAGECEELVLLVGSNPLPNYLAEQILAPARVRLVYTPETVGPFERMRDTFGPERVTPRPVGAADPRAIRQAFDDLHERAHLCYTGGTKVMAAHARMAFAGLGRRDHDASYVDERRGVLRRDDGVEHRLEQVRLTIDTVLAVHGCQVVRMNRLTEAPYQPRDAAEQLEYDVARWVREHTQGDVRFGVHFRLPGGRQCEVDVAVVRGHRLFILSCTTTADLGRCKNKLLEVALRARQLGGDLARSALVCGLDGNIDEGPRCDVLRGDVASVWDAPNRPAIFGAADLREWRGTAGDPDLATLHAWLDA